MECPGHADYRVQPSSVWLHIHKKAERAIDAYRHNAVQWKKIRSERDPEVRLICHHMPAVAANAKSAHSPTHQPNPEGMGQFMSENINENGTRKTKKRDQP